MINPILSIRGFLESGLWVRQGYWASSCEGCLTNNCGSSKAGAQEMLTKSFWGSFARISEAVKDQGSLSTETRQFLHTSQQKVPGTSLFKFTIMSAPKGWYSVQVCPSTAICHYHDIPQQEDVRQVRIERLDCALSLLKLDANNFSTNGGSSSSHGDVNSSWWCNCVFHKFPNYWFINILT